MRIDLSGRSALITGGSKGLGLAVGKQLAASGADVAILARDPSSLETAESEIVRVAKSRVAAISCDVTKPDNIRQAYEAAVSALGKIDILVNNAGRHTAGPFDSVTDETWQADFDLKVFAAIRLSRLVWPGMKERRWGRIINVLSIAAKAPPARSSPSAVSRAAGMAFTKILAGEGAPHNILANCLLVGVIEGDQLMRRYKAQESEKSYEEFLAGVGEALPLGRVGKAEEFAATVCFLASEGAGYLSGVALNVDGGASPVV